MPQGPVKTDGDPRIKAAIARAAAFLRSQRNVTNPGELALMVHALAKIHEKFPEVLAADDPQYQAMVQQLKTYCSSDGYAAVLRGGKDNYEAGCVAMALAAVDGQALKPEIGGVARYILGKQLPNGSWSYDSGAPGGDTSMTQYAILGLWEAGAAAGVNIPREAWDKIAQWLLKTQHADGGFEYHPPENQQAGSGREATHTMTVASLGSLLICRDHLPGGKRKNTRGVLLSTQEEEKGDLNYRAQTSPAQIDEALRKATEWLKNHFTLDRASGESDGGGTRWFYYYLYAFERFATLADIKQFNGVDWYAEAARLILGRQANDGSWTEADGSQANTAFAVLFLIRSTHISVKIHQRRIGRGTLVSGRYLPQNLAELEQTATGFKPKAIKGKTGELLDKIETGKMEELQGAALGLVSQMYEKKWTAVGEEGDRLKKMYEKGVKAKDPEVIIAALKLLARTGDYRVVPLLIDGMYYEDEPEVQLEARKSLCKISRKFNGFGTMDEATKTEWEEEIQRWRDWYRTVRPEAAYEDDVEVGR